ncbi:VCBS domain-containing protein [Jannaschia sp. 2305UL9-9]|uniref:VCBS domain-containing protein n=1 Tax=Jannaschia sp. 2305UL9-9 TaxID=3121638 RepID=UPI003526EA7A
MSQTINRPTFDLDFSEAVPGVGTLQTSTIQLDFGSAQPVIHDDGKTFAADGVAERAVYANVATFEGRSLDLVGHVMRAEKLDAAGNPNGADTNPDLVNTNPGAAGGDGTANVKFTANSLVEVKWVLVESGTDIPVTVDGVSVLINDLDGDSTMTKYERITVAKDQMDSYALEGAAANPTNITVTDNGGSYTFTPDDNDPGAPGARPDNSVALTFRNMSEFTIQYEKNNRGGNVGLDGTFSDTFFTEVLVEDTNPDFGARFDEGGDPVGLADPDTLKIDSAGGFMTSLSVTPAAGSIAYGADEVLILRGDDGAEISVPLDGSDTTPRRIIVDGETFEVVFEDGAVTITAVDPAGAPDAAMASLVQGLAYDNTADLPVGADPVLRELAMTLTDADDIQSAPATASIQLVGVDAPPAPDLAPALDLDGDQSSFAGVETVLGYGTQNGQIRSINLATGEDTLVWQSLKADGSAFTGQVNGAAASTTNPSLFYYANNGSRATIEVVDVAAGTQTTLKTLGGQSAAGDFYDGALYTAVGNAIHKHRLSDDGLRIISSEEVMPDDGKGFGDFVVTEEGGVDVIYLSRGGSFSKFDTATQTFEALNTPVAGLDFTDRSGGQLGMDVDGNLIYVDRAGERGEGGGNLYIIDKQTGALTPIGVQTDHFVTDLSASAFGAITGENLDVARTFTEGDGPIGVVDADFTLDDRGEDDLASVAIEMRNIADGGDETILLGGETFAFGTARTATITVNGAEMTVAFDGTTAIVTDPAGGAMDTGAVSSLIGGVQYENTSETPTEGPGANRVLAFTVTDMAGQVSPPAHSIIAVIDTPDAGGDDAGGVIEAGIDGPGIPGASGTLTAAVAPTTTGTWSGDAAGTYGRFAIDPETGEWTYALDNDAAATQALQSGESVTETFTATLTDGRGNTTRQVVTITVDGTNDVPTVTSAAQEGTVAEAGTDGQGTAVATGQARAADADADAALTWSGDAQGTYGRLAIDSDTGEWTYTLDNDAPATQALGAGTHAIETFELSVTDEHGATATTTVRLRVDGAADEAGADTVMTEDVWFMADTSPIVVAAGVRTEWDYQGGSDKLELRVEIPLEDLFGEDTDWTFEDVDVSHYLEVFADLGVSTLDKIDIDVDDDEITLRFRARDVELTQEEFDALPDAIPTPIQVRDPSGKVFGLDVNVQVSAGTLHSPIAFDLNGDGVISTTGVSTAQFRADGEIGDTVLFDLDGDGTLERIEWMDGRTDALLIDNRDGAAIGDMDGKRLFGDEGGTYVDGYAKLALIDANGDGVLTGAELQGLELWADDGDAVLETGETMTLEEAGIGSVSASLRYVVNDRGETLFQSQALRGDDTIEEPVGPGAGVEIGALDSEHLRGGDGSDTLTGGDGDDTIDGSLGLDTIVGGAGNDLITGGPEEGDLRDVVFAGAGNDTVRGGAGNDELRGDAGDDILDGGTGADLLLGGTGNDTLTGGSLGDMLSGGDGMDFLNGGFGFDRMSGGDGADRFFHGGVEGHGSDWIQDYDASEGDVLVFGGPASATAADFQVNVATTYNAGSGAVDEAFVIYTPTGQIIWALIDGADQTDINIQLASGTFDLV